MNEPKYRVRVQFYDDENGEVVGEYDQPMYSQSDDNVDAFYSAESQFAKNKEQHEATYYPKEDVEV